MPAVALQGQFKVEAGIGLECREFAVGAGFCVVKGGGAVSADAHRPAHLTFLNQSWFRNGSTTFSL